ncbi:MAG: hypothetical protein KBT47_06815 [Armatimonadetes bacterium]|nr:hypothetical protein [Candidatus Hippobium faecium]
MDYLKNKKTLSLNGEWELGYTKENLNFSCIKDMKEKLETIPAQVPGNFEIDLNRQGIIGDLFFGMATKENQKWEIYYKYYSRKFTAEKTENQELVFEGLDTICDIYLNGEFLAHTDNMMTEHTFDVSDRLIKGENEILIKFSPTYFEAMKYDYPLHTYPQPTTGESLFIRKAGSCFGWDIMPRANSCGIWRDVYLREIKPERINYVFVATHHIDSHSAELRLYLNSVIGWTYGEDRYEFEFEAQCGDSRIYYRKWLHFGKGHFLVTVDNPKLWWPKGSGDPNIYKAKARIYKNGAVIDETDFHFGIRTVELNRTDRTDMDGEGEFVFVINGKKIFCKGSNWVPMDAYHSRDRERIPKALDMIEDLNCNIIRLWGGNVYEDDLLFDICDRKGIMVWHDFGMACCNYPMTEEFMAKIKTEVTKVVRRLRQHPSIILWNGDNECDYMSSDEDPGINPEENRVTRETIPQVLAQEDFTRPYLASSPYCKLNFLKYGDKAPEGHPWGPRDYFKGKYYFDQIYHFASEIGYHGMPNLESIKKFIPEDKLFDMESDEWTLHASAPDLDDAFIYRNNLMVKQVRELFGTVPTDIESFIKASQISQGEAKKFFIEMFRSNKWRRTGLIWWNLIDGWPQFSDAVVDYFYSKKPAYEYIKASQKDVILMFKEPYAWNIDFVAVNDTFTDRKVDYKVTDLKTGETVCQGTETALADSVTKIQPVPYTMSKKTIYKIEWTGDVSGVNHYLYGQPTYDLEEYIKLIKQVYNIF